MSVSARILNFETSRARIPRRHLGDTIDLNFGRLLQNAREQLGATRQNIAFGRWSQRMN